MSAGMKSRGSKTNGSGLIAFCGGGGTTLVREPVERHETRKSFSGRSLLAVTVGLTLLLGLTVSLQAAAIPIPNGSFEAPATEGVDIRIDSWQETPKPFWYDESGGFLWDQLTGRFANPAPPAYNRIDNCDGNQALWLFALPEVGLFQDYNSTDWSHPAPTHDFAVKFEAGKSYRLTAGVLVGEAPMAAGASLELSLYYRDDTGTMVTVAATNIVNNPAVFTTITHLVDFAVNVPVVKSTDAWAGQYIGVRLLSLVDPFLAGGYWDVDNVRLTSALGPVQVAPAWAEGQFGMTLLSELGLKFEMFSAADNSLPPSGWTSLGVLTNLTGSLSFRDVTASGNQRYYQLRPLP
jgi:hypothetical protein